MLAIETFTLGPLATNAYLLIDEPSGKAVIIDPGSNPEPLLQRIESLDVEAILLTHTHFDHIGGLNEVRRVKPSPVYVHAFEADWLGDPELNGSSMWPQVTPPVRCDPADVVLAKEQTITLLGRPCRVLHTPGHSPGSVSYLLEDHLFGGDVLFYGSVGRTDLPGGSEQDLLASIHGKLFPLGDGITVYPGHGPKTTIGFERQNNPYV